MMPAWWMQGKQCAVVRMRKRGGREEVTSGFGGAYGRRRYVERSSVT
jgi:hypothetical protein